MTAHAHIRLRPTISLGGARAAYVGPGLDLAPHRNAAATVAIGLEAPFSLEILDGRSGGATLQTIALIPPRTLHHLLANGAMAFVYLDALSDDLAAIRSGDLDAAHARITRDAIDLASLSAALELPRRAAPDPRIAQVVRELDIRPDAFTSVRDAAQLAGLSPSRFQALFRAAVGMPFRRYRLWRRMALVLRAASGGTSLTTAAHDAGFASSAHLSAAFKEMFGLTPSALLSLDVAWSFEA